MRRARTTYLVLFAQLRPSQNRDDVLQILVTLEDVLDVTSDLVVSLTHYLGVENTGSRVERIHGGINPKLGDLTVVVVASK